jgi:apolipoprotein D and lipocalin family protein
MKTFDAVKYQGLWYEVARKNAPFESFCSSSTAEYTIVDRTNLSIVNRCYNENGRLLTSIKGIAIPTSQPGMYTIRFDQGQTGIYQVLYTDYDNFSFVGNQQTGYLSILSRSPFLSSGEASLLKKIAADYGFASVMFINNKKVI